MSVINTYSARYDPNTGRMRGSFVYCLLCDIRGKIYAKIGMTSSPSDRISKLFTMSPEPVVYVALAELPSREIAFRMERELHSAFIDWHSNGEWFCFDLADKEEFNKRCKTIFAYFTKAVWPVRWHHRLSQTQIKALLSLGRIKAVGKSLGGPRGKRNRYRRTNKVIRQLVPRINELLKEECAVTEAGAK